MICYLDVIRLAIRIKAIIGGAKIHKFFESSVQFQKLKYFSHSFNTCYVINIESPTVKHVEHVQNRPKKQYYHYSIGFATVKFLCESLLGDMSQMREYMVRALRAKTIYLKPRE